MTSTWKVLKTKLIYHRTEAQGVVYQCLYRPKVAFPSQLLYMNTTSQNISVICQHENIYSKSKRLPPVIKQQKLYYYYYSAGLI